MLTKLQSHVGSSRQIQSSASRKRRRPRRPVAVTYFIYVSTAFSSTAQSKQHSGCLRIRSATSGGGAARKAEGERTVILSFCSNISALFSLPGPEGVNLLPHDPQKSAPSSIFPFLFSTTTAAKEEQEIFRSLIGRPRKKDI